MGWIPTLPVVIYEMRSLEHAMRVDCKWSARPHAWNTTGQQRIHDESMLKRESQWGIAQPPKQCMLCLLAAQFQESINDWARTL